MKNSSQVLSSKFQVKKILVIKFRNIGDVLLITPLIKNLKLNYPNAKIHAAVNKGTEEMLSLNPNIEKIHIYDRNYVKKLPLFKRLNEEQKFIKKIKKEKYDLVINLTKGDRGAFIALFSKAKEKIGFKNNFLSKIAFNKSLPLKQGMKHTIEWDLDALRVLNKKIFEKRVEIFWDKKDDEFINNLNLPQYFVHIHLVSRWLFKCIDDKIAAEVIDFVENELKLKTVLTAAPVEKEMKKIENILKLTSSNPINLSGKLSLKQTAALNKRAKFFIGVDTAIMHMSAANNIPVLAFFGPSGAFNWGPWDNDLIKSGYIKQNGYQQMGKHKVIQVNWECAPCGKDGCEGSKISDCLMGKGLNITFIKEKIKEINSDQSFGA